MRPYSLVPMGDQPPQKHIRESTPPINRETGLISKCHKHARPPGNHPPGATRPAILPPGGFRLQPRSPPSILHKNTKVLEKSFVLSSCISSMITLALNRAILSKRRGLAGPLNSSSTRQTDWCMGFWLLAFGIRGLFFASMCVNLLTW